MKRNYRANILPVLPTILLKHSPILQAWALLEQEDGNKDEARRLFQLGADMDPSHTYIWQVCCLQPRKWTAILL